MSQETARGLQAYTMLKDPKVQFSDDPREVGPVERIAARIIDASRYTPTLPNNLSGKCP
jgi:hypothetical protein